MTERTLPLSFKPLLAAAGLAALLALPIATGAAGGAGVVVWNGEKHVPAGGWTNPTTCTLKPQSAVAHSGNTALEYAYEGSSKWLGAGWNWCGWKTGTNVGTDTTGMKNFTVWIKSAGTGGDLQLNLMCNGAKNLDTPEEHTDKVHLIKYCPKLLDGNWHQVVVPLKDFKRPKGFDPKIVSQIQFGFLAGKNAKGSFYIDDIGFSR